MSATSFPGCNNGLPSGLDFQDIFHNAPIGIFTSTPEGRFISANLFLARMFGYESPEVLIASVTDIASQLYVDPEDREKLSQLLERHDTTVKNECLYRRRDGTEFWGSRNAQAVKEQDGRVVSYFGFLTDITESKLKEQREHEVHERFHLMFVNAPMPYQSLDEHGNFLDVNQAFLDVLGFNREELIGKNFGDILHPDWVDHFKQNFPRFKAVGEILGVEFEMVKKDGTTILVFFNGKIQRDSRGNFKRTHCIFQDVTAQRQVEKDLLVSEERFRLSMDATSDGIWDWDIQTDQVYYSPGYARMLGYETTDIPAHVNSWLDLIHPEDREETFRRNMECIENRIESFAVEFRMQGRDGDWKWILGRGRAVSRDGSGRAIRMIGTHQNITERKKNEEKLLVYKAAVEQSIDGIAVADMDGTFRLVNKAWAKMHGYSAEELVGHHLSVCHTPEQMEHEIAPRYETLITTGSGQGEFGHTRKDGSTFPTHMTATVIRGEDGKPLGVATTARDITKRKNDEEVIRKQTALLEGILDNIPDIMSVKRPDMSIVRYNKAGYRFLGMTEEQVYGKKCYEVIGSKIMCQPCVSREAILSKKMAVSEQYFPELNRHVHCRANPILNADGEVEYTVELILDITDRKQAEEKINHINQQLQQANVEKDQLLAVIAHDLKSPMSGIVLSMKMLATKPEVFSEVDFRRLAAELHKTARNTFELLEDLLQWARLQQGGVNYSPTPCSLKDIVDRTTSTAEGMASGKDIAIRVDIAQNLVALIDQPMIQTVIRNILFNAIKFTPRGGEIGIRAWQTEQYLTMAIQDNGNGMDERVLSSVFALGETKRRLGTEGEKGTGLGLMLCKQFIDRHGGLIWVESAPGQGTTVSFTMAAAPISSATAAESSDSL